MNLFEIITLGIGLSMDAFAVAVCKGLTMDKITLSKCSVVGTWFGFFQALMPFIGFHLVMLFSDFTEKYDHWISFVLLALIGGNMIKESLSKDKENSTGGSLAFRIMLVMALATSIDALAAGAALVGQVDNIKILLVVCVIGVTTFLLSALGVKIGSIFGVKYKSKAEFAGGTILILLGIKFLLDGLGVVVY